MSSAVDGSLFSAFPSAAAAEPSAIQETKPGRALASPDANDRSAAFPTPPSSVMTDTYESSTAPHQGILQENCDRRRPDEEEDASRLPSNVQYNKTVTPFLREHIPGIYAPIGKPETQASNEIKRERDPNSKFCYRHRPDSKCRRAADEKKMAKIQNELDHLTSADQQAITHVWSLFSAAPAKHRDLMLQGIITQCCFPQLSTVSREVHEQLKIDFLGALPPELSYKVLSYLDTVSLCRAAQVSRKWRELADDDVVWHHMCEQHIDRKCTKCGWGLPILERRKLQDWKKQQQAEKQRREEEQRHDIAEAVLSSVGSKKRELVVRDDSRKRTCTSSVAKEASVPAPDRPSKFKALYSLRFKVGSNWRGGRCAIKTFKGHENGVTCLQFDDNILATGSYDAKVKIWDINTGEELRTLSGHTMGIRALKFVDGKLFTASLDRTVRVWNWQTGECISTLQGHTEGVITVDFDGKWLASGSIDKTIKVFNFDSKETFCLRGHDDWVNHVKLDPVSQVAFSASDDCYIKMWDLEHKICLKTFEGHMGQVQQILLMPEEFEPDEETAAGDVGDAASNTSGNGRRSVSPSAGHAGGALSIYPPSSFHDNAPQSQNDDRRAYGSPFVDNPSRPLPPRYIFSAGLDNTIKLWCTATGRCIRTMFGHVEGIWGLAGDSLRVISAANDSMVKIWEPTSGRCERTFTGHTGPVTCVGLTDSRMASGSEDGQVRLLSFEADEPMLEECGTPS